MTKIRFNYGEFNLRGQVVNLAGTVATMTKPFASGVNGAYVTIDGSQLPGYPERNIRIRVNSREDYEVVEGVEPVRVGAQPSAAMAFTPAEPPVPPRVETDEEVIDRLRQRFNELTEMTRAIKRGDVRGLIVSGPPGVGKSHGIEEVLERYDVVAALGHQPPVYEVVKGATSALGLYCKLYEFCGPENVVVFDDCDSILFDEVGLNILKAALDSKRTRRISWNTDSNKLRTEGIPNSFEFQGSVIFVTNLKFSNVRSAKIRDHLAAIESRCHYLDLSIDTNREKMLRIRQVVNEGMLDDYNLSQATKDEIVEFVSENQERLREVSLRSVLKCADLAQAFPNNWRNMAEATVMRRN